MIALLTIVIAIFIVIEVGAIMIVCYDEGCTDFKDADILLKLSRILLWGELGLFLILLLLSLSYLISSAIVCSSTNGDYKGCTELKEIVNNE